MSIQSESLSGCVRHRVADKIDPTPTRYLIATASSRSRHGGGGQRCSSDRSSWQYVVVKVVHGSLTMVMLLYLITSVVEEAVEDAGRCHHVHPHRFHADPP
jgi:hypothetical protein